MTNYKNSNRFIVSTLRCVPQEVTQTGTISTSGQEVTGVGTTFTKNGSVAIGDWIWNLAEELRRIVSIQSDTDLTIDHPFTTPLAGAVFKTCRTRLVEISFSNTGAIVATAGIDGVDVAAGESGKWSKSSRERSSSQDFIDPIIVDGTGSPITIVTLQ